MSKTWLITGCSTGFGRVLAQTLLQESEDRVVVTARDVRAIADFGDGERVLTLPLDVTDSQQIVAAVDAVVARFGRIDVLVNNAGYGIIGALEETAEASLRRMFETNVFGLIALTQQVLPIMRRQRSGHVINMSSVVGSVATPGFAAYCASKFAVEGISKALAAETAHLGIRVTAVAPGPFRTDFADRSIDAQPEIDDYSLSVGRTRGYLRDIAGRQPGDPVRAARAIMDAAASEAPPLHLPLGNVAWERLRDEFRGRLAGLEAGEAVARAADYSSPLII